MFAWDMAVNLISSPFVDLESSHLWYGYDSHPFQSRSGHHIGHLVVDFDFFNMKIMPLVISYAHLRRIAPI